MAYYEYSTYIQFTVDSMVLSGNKLWYRSYIRKSHQSKEASGDQNNRLVGDTRSVGIKLGYRHALVFGFVLVVYVYTALPSVPGGDAGELLAEGCQFGIPHPPGKHNTRAIVVWHDKFPTQPPVAKSPRKTHVSDATSRRVVYAH